MRRLVTFPLSRWLELKGPLRSKGCFQLYKLYRHTVRALQNGSVSHNGSGTWDPDALHVLVWSWCACTGGCGHIVMVVHGHILAVGTRFLPVHWSCLPMSESFCCAHNGRTPAVRSGRLWVCTWPATWYTLRKDDKGCEMHVQVIFIRLHLFFCMSAEVGACPRDSAHSFTAFPAL